MEHRYEARKGGGKMRTGEQWLKVVAVEEGYAKSSGNEMLTIEYINEHGESIKDRFINTEKAAWKLDQFLDAAGIAPEVGETLKLNEAFLKNRKVYADIKDGKPNDKGEIWPEVGKYIVKDRQGGGEQVTAVETEELRPDEIPF